MATRKRAPVATSTGNALQERAVGGGIEGAQRNTAEMLRWTPPIQSPDAQINAVKEMADARGRDAMQNDGLMTGAIHTHKDSIVGSQFRLICTPDYTALGFDEEWAIEFATFIESRFNLLADSTECWLDASGQMTFTDMIRLSVGGFLMTGESLESAEWVTEGLRPCKTAFQMISPTRLSNPDGMMDTDTLSRGVVLDKRGAPTGYWIRSGFPGDFFRGDIPSWKLIPAKTPWGRRQIIHIKEPMQPGQNRGISDMVSVLKQMRMTKKFSDVTLQNAVVNATYAAAIESELPSDLVFQSMGAGGQGFGNMLGQYMSALGDYVGSANNISIDGVKMPHLFPGTKLSMKPAGTPGGIGTGFEESLHRHIASPLGLSYEEFSKDYTKTNYSSARASSAGTWKFMQSRKKTVADRKATMNFVLWLEEEINNPNSYIPLPAGVTRARFRTMFYDPMAREAICACQWIGASRGQIDEVKETQAAIMRVNAGMSTLQIECARFGEDFRRIFQQQAREKKLAKSLGLDFSGAATKPGTNDRQQTMNDNSDDSETDTKQKEAAQ